MRHEWNSSDSPARCLRCGLNDTFMRRDDPCPSVPCGCGPNEACSRCSTPQPVIRDVVFREGAAFSSATYAAIKRETRAMEDEDARRAAAWRLDAEARCSTPKRLGPMRCPCGQEGLHYRTALCPPSCPHGLDLGCVLCATTRPVGVLFGQQYIGDAALASPYATTAEDATRAAARRMEQRHSSEMAQLLPVPCAHQWLVLDGKAWCPNCDKVKAPPRDPR